MKRRGEFEVAEASNNAQASCYSFHARLQPEATIEQAKDESMQDQFPVDRINRRRILDSMLQPMCGQMVIPSAHDGVTLSDAR